MEKGVALAPSMKRGISWVDLSSPILGLIIRLIISKMNLSYNPGLPYPSSWRIPKKTMKCILN